MVKLAARVKKRNGRPTHALGMGGSSPSQREDDAWHQNHLQTYKCRFVAQTFRQIKGIHYDESSSPKPSQASIRMVLGTAAVKD